MVVIGLTGSIGMGKSTTAKFFADAGVPVYDADKTVHELYAGTAAPLIEAAFPGTTSAEGVNREALGKRVLGDQAALRRLEAIVHPMVRARETSFLAAGRRRGRGARYPAVVRDRGRQPCRCRCRGDGIAGHPASPHLRACRHDGREISGAARQADARCRKTPSRRFCRGYLAGAGFRPRPGPCHPASGAESPDQAPSIGLIS
jgi:hypothetical protein